MPGIVTSTFLLMSGGLKVYDLPFTMTKGGPDNATMLLLYYLYQVGFSFWDTGYAAALTVVLIVVLVGIALLQFFTLDRRVHYR